MVGQWEINVSIGSMPEKVATAFAALAFTGAEYTPIAYLGSQVVNGINHAVLAEQLLITGKDTKNVVLMIFTERDGVIGLTNIERVVESGVQPGGTVVSIEPAGNINKTAQELFDNVFSCFVGSNVTPIALLGTQLVHGTDYIFAAEVTSAYKGGYTKKVSIVTINDASYSVEFADLLKSNVEKDALASLKTGLRIQSPWVIFYKEVYSLFAKDDEVEVLFNNDEPELKIVVSGNDEKAACIARFFPKQKKFGNVVLNCSVVGDDGQPVPDVDLPDDIAMTKVFDGNGALSFDKLIRTPFEYSILYIVFKREVVQYYSDNMYDLNGVTSTLYEDIARHIFGMPFENGDYCSFCTDAETSLGCPLGEWP